MAKELDYEGLKKQCNERALLVADDMCSPHHPNRTAWVQQKAHEISAYEFMRMTTPPPRRCCHCGARVSN